MSRRRRWTFRLAALLLPLGLLAALELGLRLAGYGYDPHFFKEIKIGGEDYFVQNDDFSRTFFPPETARIPGPIRLPARKAPGTFRIFIFGESAAMGDPEPAYGPGRYLAKLLETRYPGTQFEVINVAFTAINSHVIVPVARECARHEGDVWIVYMGNNEMVGPFGAATVFGKRAPSVPYVRLVTALRRTRVGQLITACARRTAHGDQAPAWGGMQMFLHNEISPDSPMKQTVYRNYQKNLDDIVDAGIGSGARVLLNTVAVNLRDCPPFASLPSERLPPEQRTQFGMWFTNACQDAASGNWAAANQLFAQAAGLDPEFADLQYRWGHCLLAQTNFAVARGHFQSACDDDALPFRTDSHLNDLIRHEPEKIRSDHLMLCDAATALGDHNSDGICGDETFYEHAHFDFAGSYRLACAWAAQIAPLLPARPGSWATQQTCEDRLGLSDWNRALVLENMLARMQIPPLNSQPGNDLRSQILRDRIAASHQQMNPTNALRARENFTKQLTDNPDDYVLHENFGLFLQASGDVPGALSQWRQVHDLIPQDYLAYYQLGHLLGSEGQWAEAATDLRDAVAIHPALTEGWLELANALAALGNLDGALACYVTAQPQRPQDWQIPLQAGKILDRLKRSAEAREQYRAALRLNANAWEPHYVLAGALDAAGQEDAALAEFREAARLNPHNSRAHFNYGVLLAKQNLLDDAEREFQTTLQLEPTYAKAHDYLLQLNQLRQHPQRSPAP